MASGVAFCITRPVAVGEDGIAVDLRGGRDKNVVDALGGEGSVVEGVVGAVFGEAMGGVGIAVLEDA